MRFRVLFLWVLLAIVLVWIFANTRQSGLTLKVEPSLISPSSLYIEDLTWLEVNTYLRRDGFDRILIPTGGTEQNGEHMIIGKHQKIVSHAAHQIASKLQHTLIAPVVAYTPEGGFGEPLGHMAYPGTASIPSRVFKEHLQYVCESFLAHGFKFVLLIGDSGQNQKAQEEVARKLNKKWNKKRQYVLHVNEYYDLNDIDHYLTQKGEKKGEAFYHAGLRDTSELAYVYPAGIRESVLAGSTSEGAFGGWSKANPELGRDLLTRRIESAVTQIRSFIQSVHD